MENQLLVSEVNFSIAKCRSAGHFHTFFKFLMEENFFLIPCGIIEHFFFLNLFISPLLLLITDLSFLDIFSTSQTEQILLKAFPSMFGEKVQSTFPSSMLGKQKTALLLQKTTSLKLQHTLMIVILPSTAALQQQKSCVNFCATCNPTIAVPADKAVDLKSSIIPPWT